MTDALSGDVKIPVVGEVPKTVVAGGLLITGVLIVVYYVRKQQSSTSAATAAAAASSTDQYPPDGTVGNPDDPYSTDPATGQTYGDESVGSGGTYGAYGAYSDDTGSGEVTDTYDWDGTVGDESDPYSLDPATGITYGDEGLTAESNPNGGPPFSNNSQWTTWVIQQMTETNPSLDVGSLTDALGLYISGQPVDTSQQQMIFDAIAVGGDPPVAGPTGYPPNVQLNGNTGGSGTVSTSTSTTPASGSTPAAVPAITGLHTTSVTSNKVSLAWTPVSGDFFYLVTYGTGSGSTAAVGPPTVVQATSWTSPALKSNTTYTFSVQVSPQGAPQTLGPVASVTATTT